MKKNKRVQLISFLVLIAFLTVFSAGSTFACEGGGEGGGNTASATQSDSSTSVNFDDNEESDAYIKVLEENLAASIEAGHQAQADLDDAQFWADYTINLDNVFTLGTTVSNFPAGLPISWFYQGVRRGTSALWGAITGKGQVVEDANNRTAVNKIKNYVANHPEFQKAVEMYHRVQAEKQRRGEI